MIFLFFFITTLTGVFSLYLTQEAPSFVAELQHRSAALDLAHFIRLEREIQQRREIAADNKYFRRVLNSQTKIPTKRNGLIRPSLSIVNPLDVLRQKLLLDIERHRKQAQIEKNREYLSRIGKRSILDILTTNRQVICKDVPTLF
uniref:Corticotropin-releasing factor domain-containing protein n=1 Tax=Clastoptera arizonana TaxID=38151 RepID=A0A1B6DS70_9HEMI